MPTRTVHKNTEAAIERLKEFDKLINREPTNVKVESHIDSDGNGEFKLTVEYNYKNDDVY